MGDNGSNGGVVPGSKCQPPGRDWGSKSRGSKSFPATPMAPAHSCHAQGNQASIHTQRTDGNCPLSELLGAEMYVREVIALHSCQMMDAEAGR